jgi:adenine phosphoribosyltransferase
MELKTALDSIRTIPDYPKPGIIFKDVTPLLANAKAFQATVLAMNKHLKDEPVIIGIEARGFIFASAMAIQAERAFVPVRKEGKLPYETFSKPYGLEYGQDVIEVHKDAFVGHKSAVIVDDVLATGGTVLATLQLAQQAGVDVTQVIVLLEIASLGGRKRIQNEFPNVTISTLVKV